MSDSASFWSTWRTVVVVLTTSLLTVVAIDTFLHRFHRPVHRREIVDAMSDYEHADPTTLVLGSSHARTFLAVDEAVRARTQGRERILPVPMEWGKFTSYLWVLRHRLAPLMEERDAAGELRRKSLRRFLLLTAWWDGCKRDSDAPTLNVPSRAWRFEDFLRDVALHGMNPYNRSYVSSRWGELGWHSVLISDRGIQLAPQAVRDALRPPTERTRRDRFERQALKGRRIVASCAKGIAHPDELRALDEILAVALGRGLQTTVVLYPLPPSTYTPSQRETILEPTNQAVCAVARRRGIPCFDLTFQVPVGDSDFMNDLDHLAPVGDAKFTAWALEHDLAFLVAPVGP
jgi:hypothetical protein